MTMGPEPMIRIDFMSVRRGIGSNLIGSKDGLEGGDGRSEMGDGDCWEIGVSR